VNRSSWAWAAPSSVSVPNVIVPSANVETLTPLDPSLRYSIMIYLSLLSGPVKVPLQALQLRGARDWRDP
jgi:hypothetical protein